MLRGVSPATDGTMPRPASPAATAFSVVVARFGVTTLGVDALHCGDLGLAGHARLGTGPAAAAFVLGMGELTMSGQRVLAEDRLGVQGVAELRRRYRRPQAGGRRGLGQLQRCA